MKIRPRSVDQPEEVVRPLHALLILRPELVLLGFGVRVAAGPELLPGGGPFGGGELEEDLALFGSDDVTDPGEPFSVLGGKPPLDVVEAACPRSSQGGREDQNMRSLHGGGGAEGGTRTLTAFRP